MDLKRFGAQLQTLRKQAGMSQERLATALDELAQLGPSDEYRVVDATLLSRWENASSQSGRYWKPTRTYLLHLIRLFRDYLTLEAAQQWAKDVGYQLAAANLQDLFGVTVSHSAHLNAATSFRHNLPSPLTSFINHEKEVATLVDLFAPAQTPSVRLVTILGEGGVGKTRLVLAAAHLIAQRELVADGVWFVPLAGIDAPAPSYTQSGSRPNPVISALANSLSFKFSTGDEPAAQVVRFLRKKSLLLILDNCEHLVDEVAIVVDLLQQAPEVRLWTTSRVTLNCQAEHIMPLAGLPTPLAEDAIPISDTALKSVPSMQLFIDRARQHRLSLQSLDSRMLRDMAQLCRLVDGSPLALELAANWVGHFSIAEMVDTLKRNDLSLLMTEQRDVPANHRSMTAVFEASWQLLSPAHQRTLAHLSAFRGVFSRDAAFAVTGTGITGLIALVNHSLVGSIQANSASPTHYHLHELLREFVADKLAHLEADLPTQERIASRHAAFYLTLLSERQHALYGDRSPVAVAEIEFAIDNIRAAWQWAIKHGDVQWIAKSWLALRHFCHVRNLYQEGEATFREAAVIIHQQRPSDPLVADLHTAHAFFLNQLQRNEEAIDVAMHALTNPHEPATHPTAVRAKMEWGIALSLQGKHDQAIAMLSETVAQAHALQMVVAEARGLHAMYRNHQAKGDFLQANAVLEQSVALYHSAHYTLAEGFVRDALGYVALRQGLLSKTYQHYQDSLNIYERVNDRARAVHAQVHLGHVSMYMGDFGGAYTNLQTAYLQQVDDPDQRRVASTLEIFSQLLGRLGDYERALEYAHRSLSIARQINSQMSVADALCTLGNLLLQNDDAVAALANYQAALAVIQSSGARSYGDMAWSGLGEVLIELGRFDEAQAALDRAIHIQGDLRQSQPALMLMGGLARVAQQCGERAKAIALVNDILVRIDKRDDEFAANLPQLLWMCYQVLQAFGDPRAASVLQSAHQHVQMQVATIDEDQLRHSFLTRVKVNREILAAYAGKADASDP